MDNFVTQFSNAVPKLLERLGQPVVLNGANIVGVFENDYQQVTFGDQIFESNEPLLTIATADLGTTEMGDTATIDNVSYEVAEIRSSPGGVTEIRLRETN